MIDYIVKPGDTIGVLAIRYKTTIRIIMSHNPQIQEDRQLQTGWKLKIYTPGEDPVIRSEIAYKQIAESNDIKRMVPITEHLLPSPRRPIVYKERDVSEGQTAFLRILKSTPLIKIQANGYKKNTRMLSEGTILKVYEMTTVGSESYYLVDGYHWVTSSPEFVLYDPIPTQYLDGKIRLNARSENIEIKLNKNNDSFEIASNDLSIQQEGTTTTSNVVATNTATQSFVGASSANNTPTAITPSSMASFEGPNYKRPLLQMKNAADETTTVELRALGFSANYNNNVQPTPTNAGWMINVRAHSLPTLNINGYLLETKASDEFNDFMTRYHRYLKSQKTNDFYSLGVSTLFYKQTEYKGIVTAFSYTDQSEATLHRKYTMQMLVLKEKSLTKSDISNLTTVVNRDGFRTEEEFRSDLTAMLTNPITSGTDFF